jgi:hypothetical protein
LSRDFFEEGFYDPSVTESLDASFIFKNDAVLEHRDGNIRYVFKAGVDSPGH